MFLLKKGKNKTQKDNRLNSINNNNISIMLCSITIYIKGLNIFLAPYLYQNCGSRTSTEGGELECKSRTNTKGEESNTNLESTEGGESISNEKINF